MLQMNYAQSVITPPLDRPVFLAGFGHNRRATAVHDDLYVRVLALADGSTSLALVALDLVGFFRPDVYAVIKRVQEQHPGVKVLIASTHTHHGPDTQGLWGPDDRTRGIDPQYMLWLKDQITATIRQALQSQQPVLLKTISVHVPGVVKNARNPEIVDDELCVAQFICPADGRVAANLFNFPCHPETLFDQNTIITADYPGVLREVVEKATQAPCIYFSGALGGMMTPDVKDHSFEDCQRVGSTIARAGLDAIQAATASEIAELSFRQSEFQVKITNLLFKLAFQTRILPDVRDGRGYATTEVSLIKLGGLWLAGIPGELLPRLGMALKADLVAAGALTAGVISLANDEVGYILPKEDFRYPLNPFSPGKHYEETMSISKEIGPLVMKTVQSLIQS